MNILTLMGSSALEEVADALTAYLVTEFGKGSSILTTVRRYDSPIRFGSIPMLNGI